MAQKESKEVFGGSQEVFVGIDVHKERWSLTFVRGGVVDHRCSITGNLSCLDRELLRYRGFRLSSVYEAGFIGYWLHDELAARGIKNQIVPPHRIPLESGRKVKTDRIDSRKLAVFLSQGVLPSIRIRPLAEREERQYMRAREQIKVERVAKINQIKALATQFGVECPEVGMPKQRQAALLADPKLSGLRQIFAAHVELLGIQEAQLAELVRLAKQELRAETKQRVKLLQSLPGVGELTALFVAGELPTITAFSPRELSSFVGLTPSEHSSGGKERKGRITGQGDPRLRALLVEAAWSAVRCDEYFKKLYERLSVQTASKKKAIVAVARKLLLVMRAVLKRGTAYKHMKATELVAA